MAFPGTLSPEQVKNLKQNNDVRPQESKTITIGATKTFEETLPMRENDIYMISLTGYKQNIGGGPFRVQK